MILQGIEDAAHREGYAVLVGDTQHDANREERYALMLRRKAISDLDVAVFVAYMAILIGIGAGTGAAPAHSGTVSMWALSSKGSQATPSPLPARRPA